MGLPISIERLEIGTNLALQDLDRWAEADKVIRRVFGQLKGRPKIEATEAFSIFHRIRTPSAVMQAACFATGERRTARRA
jgi:hypothetical protein